MTRLGEVGVEGESVAQAMGSHELETHTVDQAEPPPVLAQQQLHTALVQRLCHPLDGKHRSDVLREVTHGRKPETVLKQGDGFDDDVRGRPQWAPGIEEVPECSKHFGMPFFGPDEERVEPRGVGKHAHARYASAR